MVVLMAAGNRHQKVAGAFQKPSQSECELSGRPGVILAWRETLRTAKPWAPVRPATPVVSAELRRQRAISELKRLLPDRDWS
jgi:hypothetical protein